MQRLQAWLVDVTPTARAGCAAGHKLHDPNHVDSNGPCGFTRACGGFTGGKILSMKAVINWCLFGDVAIIPRANICSPSHLLTLKARIFPRPPCHGRSHLARVIVGEWILAGGGRLACREGADGKSNRCNQMRPNGSVRSCTFWPASRVSRRRAASTLGLEPEPHRRPQALLEARSQFVASQDLIPGTCRMTERGGA